MIIPNAVFGKIGHLIASWDINNLFGVGVTDL